jgi:hypothetical protein
MCIVPISCADAEREDNKNEGLALYATGTALEVLVRKFCTVQVSVNEVEVATKVILAPSQWILVQKRYPRHENARFRLSRFSHSVPNFRQLFHLTDCSPW